MNYEQKYKEALKIMESLHSVVKYQSSSDALLTSQTIEKAFPELRESEDERIRKGLITFFSRFPYNNMEDAGINAKDVISWLEKQGEQNNLLNFDEAEKEKNDFVSGQFIECRKSFNEFKELESYWLEYVGDDTYIGRSDNVLNQKFHITPRQLFTLFTHEHCPKENNDEQKENNWNDMIKNLDKVEEYILSLAPNTPLDAVKVHAKNIRFLVNDGQNPTTTPQWMIDFLDEYRRKIGLSMDYDEIRDIDGKVLAIVNWMKGNSDIQQKPVWSEEDEEIIKEIINFFEHKNSSIITTEKQQKWANWFKSLKPNHWKPSDLQLEALESAYKQLPNIQYFLQSLYNDLKNL